MGRFLAFKEGETLLEQGDEDTAAYLIKDGWLQVVRKYGEQEEPVATLGPGEIVGELGLAGMVVARSASVIALTDGEVEVINRGALIRLVNGPGDRLVPLLGALFTRLQTALLAQPAGATEENVFAWVEGINSDAVRALCNRPLAITHLPWVFGAFQTPQSVTDLFRASPQVDVRLVDPSRAIREQHAIIEKGAGGLQIRFMNRNDFCEINGEKPSMETGVPAAQLPVGEHILAFGQPLQPYRFRIKIPANKKKRK
ncbi:MAG: cyclic nucleotide-binding domain-containing protein [Mariprofundaceae bacterium]